MGGFTVRGLRVSAFALYALTGVDEPWRADSSVIVLQRFKRDLQAIWQDVATVILAEVVRADFEHARFKVWYFRSSGLQGFRSFKIWGSGLTKRGCWFRLVWTFPEV